MGKKMFREEETPPHTAQKGRPYAGPSTWCRAGGAQDALKTLSCEAGGIGGGPCHQEPRVPLYHSRTFLPQVKKDPIPTSLSKNNNNKKDPGVGFRHSWIQGSNSIQFFPAFCWVGLILRLHVEISRISSRIQPGPRLE